MRYYFIDFGLSTDYPEGIDNASDVGIYGQNKTVPELSDTVPYNPFKVDIYQLGSAFSRDFKVSLPSAFLAFIANLCLTSIM